MAQGGDTITYNFTQSEGFKDPVAEQTEDISNIPEIKVEYIDGSAGSEYSYYGTAGNGGRVENVVADVSNYDTLYIWVAGSDSSSYNAGRYNGGQSINDGQNGGGSTEISVINTDQTDSSTEPFIAAAGGGGGSYSESSGIEQIGGGGARDGPFGGTENAPGQDPPLGGTGGDKASPNGTDGYAAVNGHGSNVNIIDSGTTTRGGGSSSLGGEVRITYRAGLKAPSNVSTSVSGDNVTISWDAASGASKYDVLRAQSSGTTASDYTTITTVTDDGSSSFSYTDTDLEDGEKYYWRVESVS